MVRAAFEGDRHHLHFLDVASVGTMGTRNQSDDGDRSAEEAALSARLHRLGERLDEKEASRTPTQSSEIESPSDASGLARGLRLSSELLAGVIVGTGLGLLLDNWLGTSPWGLLVLLILGFAAGVFNVIRTAESGTDNSKNGPNSSI